MIILSWYCRGLGSPSAVPNIRNLARGHKPDILFLSETLANTRSMENIHVMLGYDSYLALDVERQEQWKGRSSGLTMFWKDVSNCRVLNYSQNFINLIVEDREAGDWRLTCYYDFPERTCRRDAWDLLRELRDMSYLLWCIIEDFNDLLSQQHKVGFNPHPN